MEHEDEQSDYELFCEYCVNWWDMVWPFIVAVGSVAFAVLFMVLGLSCEPKGKHKP